MTMNSDKSLPVIAVRLKALGDPSGPNCTLYEAPESAYLEAGNHVICKDENGNDAIGVCVSRVHYVNPEQLDMICAVAGITLPLKRLRGVVSFSTYNY